VILVAGATGNVGAEVVKVLVNAGTHVRALTHTVRRRPSLHNVEYVAGDLDDPQSLRGALDGVRGVFLRPGYGDMPGLLAKVRHAGVEHIVLLSGGAAVATDTRNALSQYMLRSEAAVQGSGVPWTLVRPVGFMSNVLKWVSQLRTGDVIRVPFAETRVAVVDPYDVAAVAARALLSNGHEGRIYRPTGPESMLPADQVRVLGTVLGRQLKVEPLSLREAQTRMLRAMPAKYVEALVTFNIGRTLDESQVLPTVKEITGRKPRTFEQWVVRHASAFR
jgi:uncharacterized protein YbjT (DUF2867 family)